MNAGVGCWLNPIPLATRLLDVWRKPGSGALRLEYFAVASDRTLTFSLDRRDLIKGFFFFFFADSFYEGDGTSEKRYVVLCT